MTDRVVSAEGAPLVRITGDAPRPILAVALHAGHAVRPGLDGLLASSDADRLREEDPHTARMVPADMRLLEVLRSRFEVDLNRLRSRAVYSGPQDAWGLEVWREPLSAAERRRSLGVYAAFYAVAREELERAAGRFERFVVLDLHSYNHRRDGAGAPPADPDANPEINVGTRRIDRERWLPVIDAFCDTMRAAGFGVRENVKFGGGHFAQWVSDEFGSSGCTLAVEFKKTYMDEWTGVPDEAAIGRVREALVRAAGEVESALPHVV